MPVHSYPPCPECGEKLIRKPAGKCPHCGAKVAEFVVAERDREEKIEKVVAVVSTILVVTVMILGGGLGVFEGVLMYAAAGALVWYLAKGTFWSETLREADPEDD
jgi:DNA-directed RNA polymerase subunit RPC12/RpoP